MHNGVTDGYLIETAVNKALRPARLAFTYLFSATR